MNKRKVYGVIFSLCLIIVSAAGISSIGFKKDIETKETEQNKTSESDEVASNTNTSAYSEEFVAGLNESYSQTENNVEALAEEPQQTDEIPVITQEEPETEVVMEEEPTTTVNATEETTPVFKYPASGEIVMDYSIDKAIFDVTLEQYRTNDSISISATKGSDVISAADGKVADIYTDTENGTTVVIDHVNGWQTTYSQLEKETAVSKGDNVTAGQKIGTVSAPSSYSVLLGDHIDFSVAQNGNTVDPKTVLSK